MMMTEVSLDELGPVDYVVVEFPAGASNFTGEMAAELLALVDAGTIRAIDVVILAGNHCRSAYLGEPVGSAVRVSGAAFGWPTDRQRTDSYSGDHCLDRGG